ncbi:hypothetical protein BDA99DRAFT_425427, partial [Phascolomyces articulosus]
DILKLLLMMAETHLNSQLKENVDYSYALLLIMGFYFTLMPPQYSKGIGYVIKELNCCCFTITPDSLKSQNNKNCINATK